MKKKMKYLHSKTSYKILKIKDKTMVPLFPIHQSLLAHKILNQFKIFKKLSKKRINNKFRKYKIYLKKL